MVELQRVDELVDPDVARRWGVSKRSLAIIVRSDPVALGNVVGGPDREEARSMFPAGLRHPAHGVDVMPTAGPQAVRAAECLDAIPKSERAR